MKDTIREKLNRIHWLKIKLNRTDYQAIKYAEGELSISQYASIREQRRAWRAEINALEAEINALRAPTL